MMNARQSDGKAQAPLLRDERIVAALGLWLAPHPTLSVREMAAAVNLSTARFSHLFSRTTGMLPAEFLRILKSYHSERLKALAVLRAVGFEAE